MELVAPAGNLQKLRHALAWGADAVYAGATRFSLRARADNFGLEDLAHGIELTHAAGKRFFLTVNSFFTDRMLEDLVPFLEAVAPLAPDALIISDPGAMAVASRVCPSIPIHVSTQANTLNAEAARFYAGAFGARRIVLARELSLAQIATLVAAAPEIEFEVFVHGAMCVAYSGRCIVSSYLTSRAFLAPGEAMPGSVDRMRSASYGDCSQTCRWSYGLVEAKRDGVVLAAEEDAAGTMLLSSRDLCMVDHLAALADAGVTAVKIEGRMKSLQYTAVTTGVYRDALDFQARGAKTPAGRAAFRRVELAELTRREYTTGFYFDDNEALWPSQCELRPARLIAAEVLEAGGPGRWLCRAINPVRIVPGLDAICPGLETFALDAARMFDADGAPLDMARAGTSFLLETAAPLVPFAILRIPDPGARN